MDSWIPLSCVVSGVSARSGLISSNQPVVCWDHSGIQIMSTLTLLVWYPKGFKRDGRRMISNLSHTGARGISEVIPSELCSLRCPSVDDAVDYILALGCYTQLVGIDLKSACRILPIHQEGSQFAIWPAFSPKELHSLCLLIGMDFVSPRGRYSIHYLDDFMIFASLFTEEGHLFLNTVLGTLADLRVPVALNKLEGVGTMVGLGILIDNALDKLACLRHSVASWLGRRFGHRLEMESLLGDLSHTAVVAKPGRIFLWQLFSLMAEASRGAHSVHLDLVAQTDSAWWDCFL